MENKIALVEAEAAKVLNRLRKDLSGKGAKKAEVRIANNVLFSKLLVELSQLEVSLIGFLQSFPAQEQAYYDLLRKPLREGFKDCLSFIHPDLRITEIHFKMDLKNRLSFTTLVLNMDIEEMIRNGTVKVPLKAH